MVKNYQKINQKLLYVRRLEGIPFVLMLPIVTYGMDFLVIFRPRFTFLLGFLSDGFLHGFPLFFRDLEFLDRPCVVHVTVNRDSFHGCPAVGFQWYSKNTFDPACFGVVGAVRSARTATFLYRYYLPHCATSSLRSMSQSDSPICSISRASMSASCCSETYSPCLM